MDLDTIKLVLPWIIVVVNVLWGVALIFLTAYVRLTLRTLSDLNSSAITNSANLARVDTKVTHAITRLETISMRTHDLVQDVAGLKALYNHGKLGPSHAD